MRKRLAVIGIGAFALSVMLVAPAFGGGALETFDITAGKPSPIPGQIIGRVIGIRWDNRCIPVRYRMNNTLDPIPNPLGAPFWTLAQATAATQASLDAWNAIPTSYIDMQVVGTVANPGLRGFDFINEVTFRTSAGFGAIASSPSVNFIVDLDLVDGDDIDEDGDSDVSSAIQVCADVDGDGDNEFPAGFYKAGTILDNDVQYNTKDSNGFRFTDNAADIVTRSVDYIGTAVHEHGHSFGLSHTLDNQISAADGNGSTMFPFIDTGDPASELSMRTPAIDDIAFASFFYAEGSKNSGPGALQAGDVGFHNVFGLIRGNVRHGPLNQNLAGASVYAHQQNGETLVSAFSGTTQLSFNPANGGLFILPDPNQGVVNGNYTLPVPVGTYAIGIEAPDGNPVPAPNISFTTQIGAFYGQHNFQEEFYDLQESDVERRIGDSAPVQVLALGAVDGINLVTNRTIDIQQFGNRNFIGFTGTAGGLHYAVQIPLSDIDLSISELIHAAIFDTSLVDASVVPVYAEAMLTTGAVTDSSVTIDLNKPLERVTGFIGQDNDFSPFHFQDPRQLGNTVRKGFKSGQIQHLFLVLRLPPGPPFPGVSNQPPLIGLDGGVTPNDAPILGRSFISADDGQTWTRRTDFNFRFGLITGDDPD